MPICVESKARAARSLIPNERCDRATCTCETRTARTRQRGAHTKRSGSTAIRESTHEDNVARRKKTATERRESTAAWSAAPRTPTVDRAQAQRTGTAHRHTLSAGGRVSETRSRSRSLRVWALFSGIWHYGHTVTSPIRVSRSGRRAAPPRLSPLTAPPDAASAPAAACGSPRRCARCRALAPPARIRVRVRHRAQARCGPCRRPPRCRRRSAQGARRRRARPARAPAPRVPRYAVRTVRPWLVRVPSTYSTRGPGGKPPCASGTYPTREAGARSPYVPYGGPAAYASAQRSTTPS